MNNQIAKPSLKQKIANYFKIFCSGNSDRIEIQVEDVQKINRRTSIKNKRISFILDRALVKLSRKNLCAEQFSSASLTKQLLESHIALRINADSFVMLQGKFSDKIMKNPLMSVKVIDQMPTAFSKNNIVLVKKNQNFKLRSHLADILVREIHLNIIEEVEQALKDFHNIMNTFIFIKYQGIEVVQLHQLFVAFKDLYLFEVERIMVLQKCYASVIYISKFKQTLMIDDNALVQFYMEEMMKKDSQIQKVDFPFMLRQLIQNNLCVEVACTIGQMMVTQKNIQQYDKQFIYLIHQRYPKSHLIIEQYLNTIKEDQTNISQIYDTIPNFHENTPLFNFQKQDTYKQKQKNEKLQLQSVKKSFISFGGRGDLD